MNTSQQKKRKFRASKKWKMFRHKIYVKQNGLCFISNKKLNKYANLHHISLDENKYEDLSNENNFVFLNKSLHETVHTVWKYYKNDPAVLDRLKFVLDLMLKVNNTNVVKGE